MVLPSGLTVRGRGLRRPLPPGLQPEFGLYLLAREPPVTPWPYRWLRWPDFRLPSDLTEGRAALTDLLERSRDQRVEVACRGGRGRTGTVLACLAVLSGVPAADAVAYVRDCYDDKAVETPWQRRYVERFS